MNGDDILLQTDILYQTKICQVICQENLNKNSLDFLMLTNTTPSKNEFFRTKECLSTNNLFNGYMQQTNLKTDPGK